MSFLDTKFLEADKEAIRGYSELDKDKNLKIKTYGYTDMLLNADAMIGVVISQLFDFAEKSKDIKDEQLLYGMAVTLEMCQKLLPKDMIECLDSLHEIAHASDNEPTSDKSVNGMPKDIEKNDLLRHPDVVAIPTENGHHFKVVSKKMVYGDVAGIPENSILNCESVQSRFDINKLEAVHGWVFETPNGILVYCDLKQIDDYLFQVTYRNENHKSIILNGNDIDKLYRVVKVESAW